MPQQCSLVLMEDYINALGQLELSDHHRQHSVIKPKVKPKIYYSTQADLGSLIIEAEKCNFNWCIDLIKKKKIMLWNTYKPWQH